MNNRYDRLVIVTQDEAGLLIGFYWSEPEGDQSKGIPVRFLKYSGKSNLNSVITAICHFITEFRLPVTIHTRSQHHTAWADDKADLFDFIVDAEEPEQALVSRYVLEA